MNEQQPAAGRSTPAVGNTLGFALLFRDRKALLRLERHGLQPGIRIGHYEAELQGIEFPLKAIPVVTGFRQHRAIARSVRLTIEDWVIQEWLTTHTDRLELDGWVVTSCVFEPRARPLEQVGHGPCLRIALRDPDGRFASLTAALSLRTSGRRLSVAPYRLWLVGSVERDAHTLWRMFVHALLMAPRVGATQVDELAVSFDPLALTLARACVAAGWKAPDLTSVKLTELVLGRHAMALEFSAGADAELAATIPAEHPALADDELAAQLHDIQTRWHRRQVVEFDELEAVERRLVPDPPTHVAWVRARLQWVRFRDRGQALAAARDWVRMAPDDPLARRELATLLALDGDPNALARMLATACRLPNPLRTQARLEFALALLLDERLGDSAGAQALLDPLVDRIRTHAELDDMFAPTLVARACTHARAGQTPEAVIPGFVEALGFIASAQQRSEARLRLASIFAGRGFAREVCDLLDEAYADDARADPAEEPAPQSHADVVTLAVRLAEDMGDASRALQWLRKYAAKPGRVDSILDAALRKRLIELLHANGEDEEAWAHVRVAIEGSECEASLLRLGFDLAVQRDDVQAHELAVALLSRLAPADQGQARVHLADALRRRGDIDRAWRILEPLVDDSAELDETRLELALHVAPPTRRDALVDAWMQKHAPAQDAAPQAGQSQSALVLETMADPRPVLETLARRAASDDPQAWIELATACQRSHDVGGELAARLEGGMRLLDLEDGVAALEQFSRVLELEPSQVRARLGTAAAELMRGNAAQAVRTLLDLLAQTAQELAAALRADPRFALPVEREALELLCANELQALPVSPEIASLLEQACTTIAPDHAAHGLVLEALAHAQDSLGYGERFGQTCLALAERTHGPERAQWLMRAAKSQPPQRAAPLLAKALDSDPNDERIFVALERALTANGDDVGLAKLLRRRLAEDLLPDKQRAFALERLIDLIESHPGWVDPNSPSGDRELLELYAALVALRPEHAQAMLRLLGLYAAVGDDERATEHCLRTLETLPRTDLRALTPALVLAEQAAVHGRLQDARRLIEAVLKIAPGRRDALEAWRRIAAALDDPTLAVDAAQKWRDAATDASDVAAGELDVARAWVKAGNVEAAFEHLRQAAERAERGSATHVEITRQWLELATQEQSRCEHEPRRLRATLEQQARARAELRRALGRDLPALELRTEALLLAERLDRTELGIEILAARLYSEPTHELLLSTLKDLCVRSGEMDAYAASLYQALSNLSPSETRDQLAAELATLAMERDDATAALDALDHLSYARANAPELLDLRDWAIRSLGREGEEVRRLDARLQQTPDDSGLIERLERLLGGAEPTARHLLAMLEDASDSATQAGLARHALLLALRDRSDAALVFECCKAAARHAPATAAQSWNEVETLLLARRDESGLAAMVQLGATLEYDGVLPAGTSAQLVEQALALVPHSVPLHRTLWRRLADDEADESKRTRLAVNTVERIVTTHGLAPHERCALIVGMSERLDRRHAAQLLREQAEARIDDEETFVTLLAALEERNHWPEVLRLLDQRIRITHDAARKVTMLKHLAHVCGELLGDPATALEHLEAALELAPTDADLLLALLDHHYAQTNLARAIELTLQVLDHVPMGDTAFISLAHRGADAALARNDVDLARTLLTRVFARLPEEPRTHARIGELDALVQDPEHRVHLLATVADRQAGSARIEALEERARLLADGLGRIDEAIEDLRSVLEDAPDRRESSDMLASLYEKRGRWTDLVSLLEDQFPHEHGETRSNTLRSIAGIYQRHLFDLPRAEQALRLALEHLESTSSNVDLAEEMRHELVGCLEQQGRYVDLAIYLERELAKELDGSSAGVELHPGRVQLIVHLARMYRDFLDDEARAARIYERLERLGYLPDDGLAALARWYRRNQRHEDLVRVLTLRSMALEELGDYQRRAEIDLRIAELLEGPLGRPHEAARFYLDAYLVDPREYAGAGARARLLLAGTDSVEHVRKDLRERLPTIRPRYQPALLALLGDILAPHEEYEHEAESVFRQALDQDAEFGLAHEGLGRLLARQGRLDLAAEPLMFAARSEDIEPNRAAEDAAIAARALLELGRPSEAEQILKDALARAPDAQRALLELARLYHRQGVPEREAKVLDDLSKLLLSSMLRAEVAYRRAMLLEPEFSGDALSAGAERARVYLLEAVNADAGHVAARQQLLHLARARSEWSIVAHMHYLAIRELSPGPQRALVHLDLAETYLDKIRDVESALRNIESALQQAPNDVIVVNRTTRLAQSIPEPGRTAERFESIAGGDNDLDDAARARLWLLAADLRMREDDLAAAEAASHRVLELAAAPEDAAVAATRKLETLQSSGERDLRQQKSGLLRLLEHEEQAAERVHILARLREIGQALGDDELIDRTRRQQIELAQELVETEADQDAAAAALLDVLTERGDYDEVVKLYESLSERSVEPQRAAHMLAKAAKLAWHGMRNPTLAIAMLHRALIRDPHVGTGLELLAELAPACEPAEILEPIYQTLCLTVEQERSAELGVRVAELARRLGLHEQAIAHLRVSLGREQAVDVRWAILNQLDAALSRVGQPRERLHVLEQIVQLAKTFAPERRTELALELAKLEQTLGLLERADATCRDALADASDDKELVALHAEILEQRERHASLAEALERLAELSLEERERSYWLTRAARTHLEHSEIAGGRRAAMTRARALLVRAREVAPDSEKPKAALLPLSFAENRWAEVLELGQELRSLGREDEEELVLVALTEAFVHGKQALAQQLAAHIDANARQHYLWSGLRHILSDIAQHGPLPRLDAVLSAAALLAGSGERLLDSLQAFSIGQRQHAGLSLGLARLHEAAGHANLSRHLYQLSAFLAERGPIHAVLSRLPDPELPLDPMHAAGWVPLEARGTLRAVLLVLRDAFVGDPRFAENVAPATDERLHVLAGLADKLLTRWRAALGLTLHVVATDDDIAGGVGIQHVAHAHGQHGKHGGEPTLVLGPRALEHSEAELRFRLARATGSIAMGLLPLRSLDPASLPDVLDVVIHLVHPAHPLETERSQRLADALAERHVSATSFGTELRNALMGELGHWLQAPQALESLSQALVRAELLFATRLCGRLDGALLAVARDHGWLRAAGQADTTAVLQYPQTQWLLRELGLD